MADMAIDWEEVTPSELFIHATGNSVLYTKPPPDAEPDDIGWYVFDSTDRKYLWVGWGNDRYH